MIPDIWNSILCFYSGSYATVPTRGRQCTYNHCLYTVQTALNFVASSFCCKITLIWLGSSLSMSARFLVGTDVWNVIVIWSWRQGIFKLVNFDIYYSEYNYCLPIKSMCQCVQFLGVQVNVIKQTDVTKIKSLDNQYWDLSLPFIKLGTKECDIHF